MKRIVNFIKLYKHKKGFTIIELLAIIAIMAILVILVVPNVIKSYKTAQMEIFKTSVKSIANSVENYIFENGEIPEEGINVSELDIANKKSYSGKFIRNESKRIEADNVSDGVFCAKGEMESLQVEIGCENLDTTIPTNLSIVALEKTSNSIKIVGSAIDNESGITKYEFKIDNNEFINKEKINNHTFIGLTSGVHTIYLRVTNGKGLTNEINIEESLINLSAPTYSIAPTGWTTSKMVTITYPERQMGFVYTYSNDEGTTWTEVTTGTTAEITFTTNGTLIGRVSDGTNLITSSQIISQIDNTSPVITAITIDTTNLLSNGFTITRTGDATDSESGLTNNPYIYEVSTDNINFATKCSNNSTSCVVTGLNPVTNYYYKVCAVDNVTNKICTESKTITTPSAAVIFENTGGVQTYTIQNSGTYKIEGYGAQGNGSGGKGGYVSGNIYLTTGSVLTINVGGQNGYNGGGTGTYVGGGATTINSGSTTLIIAAGGGGGTTGTAGGTGTGTGGAGSVGSGYPTASPSTYTSVSGTAGTNGGGGGSGNIYKNCLTTTTVVVPNTCYECIEWTCDCVCHQYVGGTCVSESCQCHNPCIGGWESYSCNTNKEVCNTYSAEMYNSGQGGSNVLHATLTNTSSSSGIQLGNGKVIITFVGS